MAVDRWNGEFCVHGYEYQGVIKRTVCIDELRNDQLLRKDSSAYKGKGKAVPLQAWSGPEGSRKLR